ncbi:hypothetical protein J2S49_000756 [Arcanobacterium wilhelmae]|uniref:Uncharacterized protein n=2 Tax=Arcanobacterium wilhelmae TaxID=1803177 RepID=A0ABT9NAG0_9ACTO|nr:hypothetical protein [Arcanobacterium wilhelmae]MDP9800680.1 hypothetical protein [Arcanobacterium wilhelmae]
MNKKIYRGGSILLASAIAATMAAAGVSPAAAYVEPPSNTGNNYGRNINQDLTSQSFNLKDQMASVRMGNGVVLSWVRVDVNNNPDGGGQ